MTLSDYGCYQVIVDGIFESIWTTLLSDFK